jgi:two-component system, NarL family, nitrate/nitrite response regulator NarL
MPPIIKVVILEDHQSIIDGYTLRLREQEKIEVVGMANNGEELESLLALHSDVDVLIMDVGVPLTAADRSPIPILNYVPKLLAGRNKLSILVISMLTQQILVKALVNAGVSGYIFKHDSDSIRNLAIVVKRLANGGTYFSEEALEKLDEAGHDRKGRNLTARQLEIISLCAAFPDLSTDQLAQKAQIASSTFRNLLSEAYDHLNVHNRAAAISRAKILGLIS